MLPTRRGRAGLRKGILGFPSFQRYVLMEAGEESYFWWLQSVDAADLAFVVTDPSLFVPTYKVPLRADQMAELGMDSIDDAQVFVIVNKREQLLTGNLQGPLVVHVRDRIAEQLVLSDRRFTTRAADRAEPGPGPRRSPGLRIRPGDRPIGLKPASEPQRETTCHEHRRPSSRNRFEFRIPRNPGARTRRSSGKAQGRSLHPCSCYPGSATRRS